MYDIEEIKSDLEELSLREKLEKLEEIQEEIQAEIDDLESSLSEVDDMISDINMQIDEGYSVEIDSALKSVASACQPSICSLLPDHTLDIEGLCCRFLHFSGNDNQLLITFNGRKPIIRVNDFCAEFKEIIKPLLPEAHLDNMEMTIMLTEETDAGMVIKDVAEKLISVAPAIAELAVRFKFV